MLRQYYVTGGYQYLVADHPHLFEKSNKLHLTKKVYLFVHFGAYTYLQTKDGKRIQVPSKGLAY